MLRFMSFTANQTHTPIGDSRILPSGYAVLSFKTAIAPCSPQNLGWFVREAVDGQGSYGQSYDGGTSP